MRTNGWNRDTRSTMLESAENQAVVQLMLAVRKSDGCNVWVKLSEIEEPLQSVLGTMLRSNHELAVDTCW